MKIYLDIDDVMADWTKAAKALVSRDWNYGERIPEADWDKVRAKTRFYRDLKIKPGAMELYQYCQDRVTSGQTDGLFFLTALPHGDDAPYAVYDKVNWCNLHFPGTPMFIGPYSHDKWRHCQPGDILIDDRTSNCEEWSSAGGQSYIYRDWQSCKTWLDGIFGT